jgi:FAD:protein FMN transferase
MSHILSFEATGTHWQIDIHETLSDKECQALFKGVTGLVHQFERDYSRFIDTSFISRLASTPGAYLLPSSAKYLLDIYSQLHQITDGLFTPTIGETLVQAGYDRSYTLTPSKLHTPPLWSKIAYTDTHITSDNAIQLDFGGAGKGYLIDLISEFLISQDNHKYTIDGGGDICTSGPKGLTIGLEHPIDSTLAIGKITLNNSSICGSSGNRRSWAGMHHIINPQSLDSPHHILSTWVIHPKTVVADALATCLFLVKPNTLTPHFDFEYLILYYDLTTEYSSQFKPDI